MAIERGGAGERSLSRGRERTCPNNGDATGSFDFRIASSIPIFSAPSSPGRSPGSFYSVPSSPVRFALSTTSSSSSMSAFPVDTDFSFSSRLESHGSGTSPSMSSADELFVNGMIRPFMPSLLDEELICSEDARGNDLRLRERSSSRRTRSLSPMRSPTLWRNHEDLMNLLNDQQRKGEGEDELTSAETTPSMSASSSRSSSGRRSRRWMFVKDFLYRNKSEGRSSSAKFWSLKEKNRLDVVNFGATTKSEGKRRVLTPSPHEVLYTSNRAQAEELRRRTFLPYRQGLLGCLGFSSKSYGVISGFAKALKPVASR